MNAGLDAYQTREADYGVSVRLEFQNLISQPDNAFRTPAERVIEKTAELYRRLA